MARHSSITYIAHGLLVVFVCALVPKDFYHSCVHEHELAVQPLQGFAQVANADACGLCDVIAPVLFAPTVLAYFATGPWPCGDVPVEEVEMLRQFHAEHLGRGPPALHLAPWA